MFKSIGAILGSDYVAERRAIKRSTQLFAASCALLAVSFVVLGFCSAWAVQIVLSGCVT